MLLGNALYAQQVFNVLLLIELPAMLATIQQGLIKYADSAHLDIIVQRLQLSLSNAQKDLTV